jgi:hypothetical protein
MGCHKNETIDRIKEFAQEGLYLSDPHIVVCKYCNVCLQGQKKDTQTKHTTSAKHLKKKNTAYLITVGLKNSDMYFLFFFLRINAKSSFLTFYLCEISIS